MRKSVKTTTLVKKQAKTRKPPIKTVEQEYYMDCFSFTLNPVSQDYLKKFALEWVHYVRDNEDVITLKSFFIRKGVTAQTVWGWEQRCPELKAVHEFVLEIIGDRREHGALTNKYDSRIVMFTQSIYDPRWKEHEIFKASLNSQMTQHSGNTITVVMEPFANTDLVPVKKTSENE